MKISSGAVFAILFLCTVIVYFFAAVCGFVYDDGYLLVQNPFIRDLKLIPQMFAMDVTEMTPYQAASGYYRPVSMVMLTLLFQVFKLNAFLWHFFNLLLHTAASFFVFQIIRRLGAEFAAAAFGALIFTVHPVHVEAVVPVYNYMGVLAACCALFACWCWMEYRLSLRKGWGIAALAAYAMGVFSKEDVLVLPAVFFLYDLIYTSVPLRKKFSNLLPFAGIAVLYVAMRLLFVERGAALGLWDVENKFNLAPAGHAVEKILLVLQVYVSYFKMLVWPAGLTVFHSLPKLAGVQILWAALSLAAVLLGIAAARRSKIILFSAGWFFITSFLISNIIPIGGLFAERLMYLPSAAFAFLAAWAFQKMETLQIRRGVIPACAAVILAAYTLVTWAYIPVWQNDVTLWKHAVGLAPERSLPRLNLAEAYFARGEFAAAVPEYRKTLELPHASAKNSAILQKLGRSLGETQDYESAIRELKRAKETNPGLAGIDFDLGWTYLMLKNYSSAAAAFELGLKTDPENSWLYFGRGEAARLSGEREEAIRFFREALRRNQNPQFAEMIGAKLKEQPVLKNA